MRFASFKNPCSIQSVSPLTDDQMRNVVPSIFAVEQHQSRSDRYTYIPTIEILNGLRKEGFQPFMACQTRVRDSDKRDFTRHMLRMRHISKMGKDCVNEIILLNSHDGTACYQMIAGTFRFVCSNGLVVGDTYSDVKVRHKGNVQHNVIEGAFEVLESFDRIDSSRSEMEGLILTEDEQEAYAKAAIPLKYDDQHVPIKPDQLLMPRRRADTAQDLWTTFNCVQENIIRGGVQGRSAKGKSTTTRPITGVDQSVKLNRALWTLAEEMKKLKQA